MLALDCPFFHIQEEIMFIQHVFKKGLRPPLKTIQSKACRELLTKSWAPLLNDRPPMDVLANCLRQEASELQFGKEEDYDLQRRRSTFVFKSAASEVDDAA